MSGSLDSQGLYLLTLDTSGGSQQGPLTTLTNPALPCPILGGWLGLRAEAFVFPPYLCTRTSTATPRSTSPTECSTLTTVSRKVTLILRSTVEECLELGSTGGSKVELVLLSRAPVL